MRHPVRLILALFFFAMTAHHVMREDALFATMNATCGTYWLVTWIEED